MLRRSIVLVAALAALVWGPAGAQGQVIEVGSAKFAPTTTVAGVQLQLNGAGMRHKFVVKVYAAGLYLQNKASTPEAVITAPGPKRVHVVMQRAIDASEFGKLFTDSMRKNAPKEDFGRLIPGIIRYGEIFATAKRMEAGDSFYADYVPGVGTLVIINGKSTGEPIKEPEFYRALLLIWLGKDPADWQLKDAMLGASK